MYVYIYIYYNIDFPSLSHLCNFVALELTCLVCVFHVCTGRPGANFFILPEQAHSAAKIAHRVSTAAAGFSSLLKPVMFSWLCVMLGLFFHEPSVGQLTEQLVAFHTGANADASEYLGLGIC